MPISKKQDEKQLSSIIVCLEATSEKTKALVDVGILKASTGATFSETAVVDGAVVHQLYLFLEGETPAEAMRMSLAETVRSAVKLGIKEVQLSFEGACAEKQLTILSLLAEVLPLVCYDFPVHKTLAPAKEELSVVVVSDAADEDFDAAVALGEGIAFGVKIAKDTINEPADVIYPMSFAKLAEEQSKELGFTCEIMETEELAAQGFNMILAVGQGGVHAPVLLKLTYTGAESDAPYTALVGKGITIDTGGYCLKEGKHMSMLKGDMGGAAAVLGAMCSIAKNKVKANVIAVMPLCENLIGSKAYFPGNVLTSHAGKTVEITNTDAEGRLILADALDYVTKMEQVDKIIDTATLTGSAAMTFGMVYAAAFTNDDAFLKEVQTVGNACGELIWQLPLHDHYKALLMSSVADMQNCATNVPFAGAISAGMFLKEFAGEKPWLHIDMAGASMSMADMGYKPTGVTGFGARLLYNYIAK